MLRKFGLLLTLLLTAMYARAQLAPINYGINGSIVGPNNLPFNGTLSIELARPTALNICTSPVSIVAQSPAIFQVVNGAIVNGTAAKFLTNTCLVPSIPYFAQMFDSKKNLVYADNWYFPRMSVSNVDVGTLEDVGFGEFGGAGGQSQTGTNSTATPIIVAIPSAIVSNPAGDQTITQPGSTFLSINNLTVTGTFIATAGISGSITGNAATATALASTPSQCTSGYFATGIQSNGNANCSNTYPTNLAFGNIQITGASSSYATAGNYLNYNQASSNESDFVTQGTGGWFWYPSTGAPGTPVMKLTPSGTLFATQFNGTLLGNASTATSLAATPTQCPGGQLATGITALGNANCTSSGGVVIQSTYTSTGICTTANAAWQSCSTTLNWPTTFAGTPHVTCSAGPASNLGLSAIWYDNVSTSSVRVWIQNGDASAANPLTVSYLSCIGVYGG